MEVHVWELVRDAAGRITTWRLMDANPAALRSWGRALADIVGLTPDEIFPGADALGRFMPIVREIFETGHPREWEMRFAGTDQVLRMVSYPVGEFFVSAGFDVSPLRSRERELGAALEELEQATRAGGVGLWDWDLRTDQVRYSDEWKRQLGYRPEEIEGAFEEWRSRVHPDDLEATLAAVKAVIESTDRAYEVVFRMRHRDGSYRWILAQGALVLDDDERPVRLRGSHIDITERRRLEERVAQTQRLASVSTLAGGIAHDFNNLLTAMTVNLSILDELPTDDAEARELLAEVRAAASKAQGLTAQLLTFSKGGAPVREVASIRDLLVETANFVVRGSKSRCEFDLPEDLANVEADVGQIARVIENLIINAQQAMPSGGTIRLEARNLTLAPGAPDELPPGAYVELSIADRGSGIAPEHLDRIFDPFFSTKASGSGLGLSTSHSIVARHGGRLTAESEPGSGSVFRVVLPASGAAVPGRDAKGVISGSGRVLVMEDDPELRRITQRLLRRLGYTCHVGPDGDAVQGLYEQGLRDGRGYDAVILDLTIPGQPGGTEVLGRLREVDPAVRAIVVSGYATDDVLTNYRSHGFVGFLRKPMDAASLSRVLAKALADRP